MEKEFIKILEDSPLLMDVFEKIKKVNLPNYYIGAGAIVQTVWNYYSNKPYDYGIEDLDIVYYDKDISYESEDRWIKEVTEIMKDISIPVDLKNQARVHIWYEEKFKTKVDQYKSVEDAIDSWPTTATSLGIRITESGYKIYAPFGLEDVMSGTIRANKKQITEEIYNKKVSKWTKKWNNLKVVKW